MATTTPPEANKNAAGVLSDMAASAADGFRRAANDAAAAAERTAPEIRRRLSKTAYFLAYGLSFGAVYTGQLVWELLPEDGVLRQGLRDGAQAARDTRAAQLAESDAPSLALEPQPGEL
jgi:hypothetical protein